MTTTITGKGTATVAASATGDLVRFGELTDGTSFDLDINSVASNSYSATEQALSGTTPTLDVESGSKATLTLTGNTTLTITNLID